MRFERAALFTFLTNLAINLCGVVTGVLTARLLLPEGRGELAAVILWPNIIGAIGIMGTNWALARLAAQQPEKEADLARTALVLSLSLAGFCMVLGYFLVPHLLPADKHHLIFLVRIYLLWLPLNFLALNLIALDFGRLRWWQYNLLRFSLVISNVVFILIFWLNKIDRVAWFVVALLVSNLITVILRIVLQRRAIIRGRVHLANIIATLKNGLPFWLAAIGAVVAGQMDKALVVSLLSSEAMGWYAAAFTFASTHASLGQALGITSFAALANEPDAQSQGQFLAKVFRQASLLYLGAGTAVALLAPLFIVPLFGPQFAPAVKPATVLAVATSLVALADIFNQGLRGLGNTYPGIGAQFVGGGAVALAAWHLIPRYGLTGMATAAVFGSLVQLTVLTGAVIFIFKLSPVQLWGLRPKEVKILYGRLHSLLPYGRRLLKEPR